MTSARAGVVVFGLAMASLAWPSAAQVPAFAPYPMAFFPVQAAVQPVVGAHGRVAVGGLRGSRPGNPFESVFGSLSAAEASGMASLMQTQSELNARISQGATAARAFTQPPFTTAVNAMASGLYSLGLVSSAPKLDDTEQLLNMILGYYANDPSVVALAQKAAEGKAPSFQLPPHAQPGLMDMAGSMMGLLGGPSSDMTQTLVTKAAQSFGLNPAMASMAAPMLANLM